MGFFSSIFDFAKTALPAVVGYAVTGSPLGAAAGGALGGAVFGDDPLKGALIGGATGYLGGSVLSGSNPLSGLMNGDAMKTLTGGNSLLSLANLAGNVFSGMQSSSAAKDAAGQLQQSAQRGIDLQNQSIERNTANVSPYLGAGAAGASTLQSLVTDPNAQASFIQNNPFYQQLATDAKNQIFSNAAATGKLGSGGTAVELQNRLMSLGSDLLNRQIGQTQSLANMGLSAASGLNSLNQGATDSITGLITDQGSAQAAGIIGSQNNINESIQSFLKTQGQLAGIKI